MTVDRARLARAGCLLAFALLIGKLLATGQMVKYMTPTLDPLSAATGVALAAMAALEIRGACRRRSDTRGHDTSPGREGLHAGRGTDRIERAFTALLVLAPVALGLLVTPRALGSGALGGEQVSRLLLAFGPARAQAPTGLPSPSAEPPLEDVGAVLAHLRQVGESGVGRRVRVIGMVTRSDTLAPTELALLRYAIVHCVADARPVALLVVGPRGADLAADQWIEVEGVLAIRQREGDRLVTVVADRITLVEEPANPYLAATY